MQQQRFKNRNMAKEDYDSFQATVVSHGADFKAKVYPSGSYGVYLAACLLTYDESGQIRPVGQPDPSRVSWQALIDLCTQAGFELD